MSRFNAAVRTGLRGPLTTTSEAAPTALGGGGFMRDTKSELYLLAVSSMANTADDFHETASDRDSRFNTLVREVAVSDPTWFLGFLRFLRNTANMRSASLIAAAEGVKARLEDGGDRGASTDGRWNPGNRTLIESVLQRADEPGEMLAYWSSQYGRNFPMPVKRGVADAARRLYTERAVLKWDSDARGYRFADVLQLTHSASLGGWKSDLYDYILDARYKGAEVEIPESLKTLRAHRALADIPKDERRSVSAGQLNEAGMTWEAYSGWLGGEMDTQAWETIIPSMPYMALLRNLRNFDKARISRQAAREVEDKLIDPDEVAKSRQLPMRFMSAYRATQNSGTVTAWGPTIERALELSLANVPALKGRTLILVDVSGSMGVALSAKSELRRVDAAAVFGAALALRAVRADLRAFDHQGYVFNLREFGSVLPLSQAVAGVGGGGTDTAGAIRTMYDGHDRIVIVTDEQYGGGPVYSSYSWQTSYTAETVDQVLDRINVPTYTWNLGGYKVAQGETKRNRWSFGGLNDSAFKMVNLIESGQHASFPWQS